MKCLNILTKLILILVMPMQLMGAQTHHTHVNYTVLLNNERNWVPVQALEERKIAYVGGAGLELFGDMLSRYAEVEYVGFDTVPQRYKSLDEKLKFYNTLIFAITDEHINDPYLIHFLNTQAVNKQVIVVFFGDGVGLSFFDQSRFPVLWNADLDEGSMKNAAMSVFGGLACTNHLKQSFSFRYTSGSGFTTERIRITYADASVVGINKDSLERAIDDIAKEAIRERATPGLVVMVLKQNKVIFEKAYGHHTYEADIRLQPSDIFDMASITKIAATTPVIMRLVEEQVIHLDSTIGYYLVQAQQTNKELITLREVMLHEAGFIPYIPFYRELKEEDLETKKTGKHTVEVADDVYLSQGYYENVMWPVMLDSKLNARGKYVYSDISMYVMKEVAEHQTGVPIQDYVQDQFYHSLGMKTAGFNPRKRFERERIVPTEYDQVFRKTLLQGHVHDQGAAMAGGIAGHAGMFANANDLAIYGQMLLNRGEYGGKQYFKPETVDLFTSNQSATSRRGLGFDRKDPDANKKYPSEYASLATYGHTGYTGTSMWVDPEEQLIYIFLSNRVHPTVSSKLGSLSIRSRIQDAIYQAIFQSREEK